MDSTRSPCASDLQDPSALQAVDLGLLPNARPDEVLVAADRAGRRLFHRADQEVVENALVHTSRPPARENAVGVRIEKLKLLNCIQFAKSGTEY